MQVAPQPEEPVVVSEQPTQHFSPELGLGTVVNATDVVDALTVGALLDLIPTSTYVGVNGSETPVCADDPVVDVVGVDRKLFDAANATKARTHFCWGMPGSLEGGSNEPPARISQFMVGFAEGLCCVPPWVCTGNLNFLFCTCSVLGNTFCDSHEDMEFPPWAGAALVMTDKGVIGRRDMRPDKTPEKQAEQQVFYARFNKEVPPYARDVNAISWSGFDVDRNVRIRPYDAPKCTSACDPISNDWDPLVVGPRFGLVVPCCRYICIQPKEPGLYRARIQSTHKTDTGLGLQSTGSIELLALAWVLRTT